MILFIGNGNMSFPYSSGAHEFSQLRGADDQRFAVTVVTHTHAAPCHRHPHSYAQGLAECFLRGEALGKEAHRISLVRELCKLRIAKDSLRETLAKARHNLADAVYGNDIGADTVNHHALHCLCSP